MSALLSFWGLVGAVVLILFALSLREARILSRMHREHPERGLYWFNVCFFLVGIIGVLLGAHYLDARRVDFERIIAPYPDARYAHERNGLVRGSTWIYVSKAGINDIHDFYLQHASEAHIPLIDDPTGGRTVFRLPSGDLYLTLTREGDHTVLYFSREGSIRIIKNTSQ